jgi:hypothetical protein
MGLKLWNKIFCVNFKSTREKLENMATQKRKEFTKTKKKRGK